LQGQTLIVLDGGNLHEEDKEGETSSHELISFLPYQHFIWDEGIVVENIDHIVSSFYSTEIMISREFFLLK